MKALFAAVVVLALSACAAVPVAAQECASLSDVVGVLEKQGTNYVILPEEGVQAFVDDIAEKVLGLEIEGVTNVIVAALGDGVMFGIEIDGCLLGPVAIPGVSILPTVNV